MKTIRPFRLPESDEPRLLMGFNATAYPLNFQSVLITGATGLVGRWLLASLDSLNNSCNQRSHLFLVSRSSEKARHLFAHLKSLDIDYLTIEEISPAIAHNNPLHIWHLAADTGTGPRDSVFNPISADLKMTLAICKAVEMVKYKPNILYTSSGAVYGRSSAPIQALPLQVSELDLLKTDDLLYGHGKVLSEILFYALSSNGLAFSKIARLFSFVGPLLPLQSHFAIGNFMYSALTREPIRLKSTGKSVRSWMYLGDLARVLLLLAAYPDNTIVDVGSGEAMTIFEAAKTVAELAGIGVESSVLEESADFTSTYVPNLEPLDKIFRLERTRPFRESVETTLKWMGYPQAI